MRRRERFENFHMAGHWDDSGARMVEAIARVVQGAGAPRPGVRNFPWAVSMLASPFVPFLRELREMHYLWRQRVRLDNARLLGALSTEPHTPSDEAVRATLAGLGCLSLREPLDAAAALRGRAPQKAPSS